MTDLIGSEKQIAWATELRQQMQPIIADMLRVADRAETEGLAFVSQSIRDAHALLATTTSAGVWIDLRTTPKSAGFSAKSPAAEDQTWRVIELAGKYCLSALGMDAKFSFDCESQNYLGFDDED